MIQLGAILAVVVQYRRLLWERAAGLMTAKKESVSLLVALTLGFVPAAIVGLLLRKKIKALLFGPAPVAIALIVGGILMMVIELAIKRRKTKPVDGLEHVTPLRAFLIGVGQCFAMWPGSSRSMCTILTGQLTGLSTGTSAEFSFLLGLPTLGAATIYEAYKSREALAGVGGLNVLIGLVVSFVVAWAVIAGFIAYLKSRGLLPFGLYRIVLGVIVFLVLVRG